ncbi:hypothetical protein GCM10008927_26550 [Amylibacter ulvae]|uniref:Uncharacterized protein n=1 Tax=Paramylibacter ulvae TaxID=1651968 RepID=A0ABQ3D653_9RHOB|nr:DUF5665 domain-containing protein [Amylibacter ulvae]GHA59671.1 hypothetical protein GCM10008927_26550 [Amylibacter ulvae]
MNDEPEKSELSQLLEEVQKLNRHHYVRAHDSWWGLISYQVVRGLAFGLGSVVGATVLVSVMVYVLGQLDFIPILGEWASQILDIIQQR